VIPGTMDYKYDYRSERSKSKSSNSFVPDESWNIKFSIAHKVAHSRALKWETRLGYPSSKSTYHSTESLPNGKDESDISPKSDDNDVIYHDTSSDDSDNSESEFYAAENKRKSWIADTGSG
jgi:hypothetical protein